MEQSFVFILHNKPKGLELESPLDLEPVGTSAFWATKSKTEVWEDINILYTWCQHAM